MADWDAYIAELRQEHGATERPNSSDKTSTPGFEFGDALESSIQKKVQNAESKAELNPFKIAPHLKKEKAETSGPDWFNVPKANLTEEEKRDWDLLRMRSVIGKQRSNVYQLPEKPPDFMQFGVVVGSALEGKRGKLSKKFRGRTIAESLAKDADFRDFLEMNVSKMKKKRSG